MPRMLGPFELPHLPTRQVRKQPPANEVEKQSHIKGFIWNSVVPWLHYGKWATWETQNGIDGNWVFFVNRLLCDRRAEFFKFPCPDVWRASRHLGSCFIRGELHDLLMAALRHHLLYIWYFAALDPDVLMWLYFWSWSHIQRRSCHASQTWHWRTSCFAVVQPWRWGTITFEPPAAVNRARLLLPAITRTWLKFAFHICWHKAC